MPSPKSAPNNAPSLPPEPPSIAERVAKAGGIDGILRFDRTILIDAIITGDLKGARQALKLGANPNIADDAGRSPLFYAVGTSYRGEKSEDPKAPAGTPHQLLVIALLKAGANPNVIVGDQGTCLESALFYKNIWPSLTMLNFGADPTLLSAKGKELICKHAGREFSFLEEAFLSRVIAESQPKGKKKTPRIPSIRL